MISVFVMGLLPDFFAIAETSKTQKQQKTERKNCERQFPTAYPSPARPGRLRGRLDPRGMKLQPENVVSGPKKRSFQATAPEKPAFPGICSVFWRAFSGLWAAAGCSVASHGRSGGGCVT
ncbi:MAG: hypothetical protein ACKOOF_05760, partial [Planctomycetaceae bacterium]